MRFFVCLKNFKELKDLKSLKKFSTIFKIIRVMYNQSQSTSACLKKDMELIAREEGELTQRLAKELVKLAHEGIGFYLPIVVVDHVADTESNISFVKSQIKKCAKEGVENGDGLNLFKIRRVPVKAMVDGNMITSIEVMIILQCEFCDAHQAIYRTLNQTVATTNRRLCF